MSLKMYKLILKLTPKSARRKIQNLVGLGFQMYPSNIATSFYPKVLSCTELGIYYLTYQTLFNPQKLIWILQLFSMSFNMDPVLVYLLIYSLIAWRSPNTGHWKRWEKISPRHIFQNVKTIHCLVFKLVRVRHKNIFFEQDGGGKWMR